MKIAISINEKDQHKTLLAIDGVRHLISHYKIEDKVILEFRENSLLTIDLKTLVGVKFPKIATLRSKEECGAYSGTDDHKKGIYHFLIENGIEYIDNELNNYISIKKKETKEIVSYHDPVHTPPLHELEHIFRQIDEKADIIKLITTLNFQEDLENLKQLYSLSDKPKIIFGMANPKKQETYKFSEESRLYCLEHGFLTFVPLEKGKETAPGQITIERIKEKGYI